jgi:prepilin-type N-terminal cleavage/methylation domain-containing protein
VTHDRPQSGQGFTVLEVLIAMIVLSIGLLGLLAATGTSHGSVSTDKREVQATEYAAQKLEDLRNQAFEMLATGADVLEQGGLARTWTVAIAGVTPNRLATITVWVAWQGPIRAGNVELQTQRAE